MVFRTLILQVGAKRVPLIKFRKGGYETSSAAGTAGTNQASYIHPISVVKENSSAAIEDWELPPRFARKPITPEEMEYINRGGPA
ncbi:28S ribosomal protein S36, mitochondrial isoform X2 [Lucilia cuprina]|uniref:28S ribosomal protein S36, mitochondrial isoform X2 n=1 Tax=Lucilia sericata TaxID=13632 RepID=UPI0018A805F2|nr:28S ribosomal protein S36, mitochondrial isoform X2 [Lucilia sericata]XP_046810649.1 28S ribosomal protein S36, mitochondrial isoform X2 [Lucilia cuprina]